MKISEENDKIILEYFLTANNKVIAGRTNRIGILKKPEYKEYLENRFDDFNGNYIEVLYKLKNNITEIPRCLGCGIQLRFLSFSQGYGKWCNSKCQLSNKEFIAYRTSLLNYKEINKKSKETKLKKYGDENYNNREKSKITCKEKYGTEEVLNIEEVRKKIKETSLQRYGVESYSMTDECLAKIRKTKLERYGDENYINREKINQTCLEKYGSKSPLVNEEVKEKTRKTNLKRYGKESYHNNQKAKETCKKKYDVENPFVIPEIRARINYEIVINTKRKNKTFNTSKIEEQVYQWLIEKFSTENVIRQYKEKRYPFCCDFYIKTFDLFIEINGNWTHGPHPFNDNNKEDLTLLEEWKSKSISSKYYQNAINVWIKRDIKKRMTAQENNLNYLEIFSIDFEEIKNLIIDKINL